MPAISDIVKDASGNPASRLVRAYRRDTGAFVGQVLSDPTTGAYSITTADTTEHFVLAHDTADADPNWNDVLLALRMNDSPMTDIKGNAVTMNSVTRVLTPSTPLSGNTHCASFPGNSYISVADSPAIELGSGDFFMRGWVSLTAYSSSYSGAYSACLVGKDNAGARAFNFRVGGTASSFNSLVFSTAGTELSASGTFSLNSWDFVEVAKVGTSLRFFVNGTQIGATQTHSTAIADVATALTLGGIVYSGFQYYLNGYMLDWEIGRSGGHTANYTAPTAPFTAAPVGGTENAVILDRITPV